MGALQLEPLRRQEEQPERPARNGEQARRPSLVEQAALMWRESAQPGRKVKAAGRREEHGPAACADGYVRRTPVQVYQTSAGYRKRWRRHLGTVLIVVLAALAIVAIWRAGLLSF